MQFEDAPKTKTILNMNNFKKWEYESVNDIKSNAVLYKDDPDTKFWDKYLTGKYISSPVIQEAILKNPYATDKALIAVLDNNPTKDNMKILFQRENTSDRVIAYALDIGSTIIKTLIKDDAINDVVSNYIVKECLERAVSDIYTSPFSDEEIAIRITKNTECFLDFLKNNGENEKINTAIYNNINTNDTIRDMTYENGIIIEQISAPLTKKSEISLVENSLYVLYDMPINKDNEDIILKTAKFLSAAITNGYLSNDAQILIYDTVSKNISSASQFCDNVIINALAEHGTDICTLINIYTNKFANAWLKDKMVYKNKNCPIKYKKEKEEYVCNLLHIYKEENYPEKDILQEKMYKENEFIDYAINRCDDFPKLINTLIELDYQEPQLKLLQNKKLPYKYFVKMFNSNHPTVEISSMFISKYIDKYVNHKGMDEFVKCAVDYIAGTHSFSFLKKGLNKIFDMLRTDSFSQKNIERFADVLEDVISEYAKKHSQEQIHLLEMQDVLRITKNMQKYIELSNRLKETLSVRELRFIQNGLLNDFTNQKLIDMYYSYDKYKKLYDEYEKEIERREKECEDPKDQPQTETLINR